MRRAADLLPTLQAAAGLVLAFEAVNAAAKEAEASLRVALASAMDGTGCTGFETEGHTVSLKDTPRRAVVTDEKAIPPEYLKPREPAIDRIALRAALLKGPVTGAELDNGGGPIISISRRKA